MSDNYLERLHKIEIEILNEIVRICEKEKLQYFLIGGTLLGAVRHKGFIPWDDDLDIAMPRESYEKFINATKIHLDSKYEVDFIETNAYYWLPFIKIRKKNTIYREGLLGSVDNTKDGVWVDIFPLDNAKYQESFLQKIQAKAVKKLRHIITLVQGYHKTTSMSGKITKVICKSIGVKRLFKFQEKLMKIFNSSKNSYFYINLGSQYNYVKQTIPMSVYHPAGKLEFEGKLYSAPRDYGYILSRIYGDYMELPPENKRITHKPSVIKLD